MPWADDVEVVQGDLGDLGSLRSACRDIDVVYLLVHAMGSSASFAEDEARGARNLAEAAADAGVDRIVYLGGLHPQDGPLSPHLASRAAVGQILLEARCPQPSCRPAR